MQITKSFYVSSSDNTQTHTCLYTVYNSLYFIDRYSYVYRMGNEALSHLFSIWVMVQSIANISKDYQQIVKNVCQHFIEPVIKIRESCTIHDTRVSVLADTNADNNWVYILCTTPNSVIQIARKLERLYLLSGRNCILDACVCLGKVFFSTKCHLIIMLLITISISISISSTIYQTVKYCWKDTPLFMYS